MIKLIVGEKGSGKTKAILDAANEAAAVSKGHVAFLDKDKARMFSLSHKVRLIDTSEFAIKSDNDLIFFIKGILAANCDYTDIFIDGVYKITRKTFDQLEWFFTCLNECAKECGLEFTLTISCAQENLPEYLKKLA